MYSREGVKKKSSVFKFGTFIGRFPSDGTACMPVNGVMTSPSLDQSVRTNESRKTRFAKEQRRAQYKSDQQQEEGQKNLRRRVKWG